MLEITKAEHRSINKQNWIAVEASKIFDISIGKTPPRKEGHWFSKTDCSYTLPWISISDMGSTGVFIDKTNEYLTADAVEQFNVVVVPENTIVLSFKLTVGRVSITNRNMCTNEAIAHFKIKTPILRELLYLQLLDYNYENLGNTSSIATAVNSKTIRAMSLLIPPSDELERIHNKFVSLFNQIRVLQKENQNLVSMRNIVLSKLVTCTSNYQH